MFGDAHDGDRHIDDGEYTFPDSVQVDWTWPTSDGHPSQGDREAEVNIWELHGYVHGEPGHEAPRA